ncbi:MAG: RNase A-like domain-containing protein [Mycobacteriales bacterium]
MTTAIALARPSEVLRAAALLGASADEMGTAVSACRRSADVQWVGRPNEQYQGRLAGLAHGLSGVRTAFDSAGEELLAYARALAWAQPLAEEAERLAVLPAGEALMDRALSLRAAAEEASSAAAARLVAALDALTDRAPRVSGWTTAGHHAASFAAGLADAAQGVGSTFVAAVHALPRVGSRADRAAARDRVVDTVEDALQPWRQVRELYDALTDGHAWYTSGQLAASAVFRFRGARGAAVERFGSHDELPDRVMLALDRGGAALDPTGPVDVWLADHLRQQFVQALLAFENMPLPLLDDLDLHGVDLVHQEAGGGHTLQRHVGRDPDFLADRQRWEYAADGGPKAFSSFSTIDEAEALVTQVVRNRLAEVRAFLADPLRTRWMLDQPLPSPVGTVLDATGALVPAGNLGILLVKVDGTVRVHTAVLNP